MLLGDHVGAQRVAHGAARTRTRRSVLLGDHVDAQRVAHGAASN